MTEEFISPKSCPTLLKGSTHTRTQE